MRAWCCNRDWVKIFVIPIFVKSGIEMLVEEGIDFVNASTHLENVAAGRYESTDKVLWGFLDAKAWSGVSSLEAVGRKGSMVCKTKIVLEIIKMS